MNAPVSVHNSVNRAELRIEWPDGALQQLSHLRLRAACPCSRCCAARLQGCIDLAPAEVRLRAIHLQGYGVQLVFSDGHDRGIYPWPYLRELERAVEIGASVGVADLTASR